MPLEQSRRRFLTNALAGAGGLGGAGATGLAGLPTDLVTVTNPTVAPTQLFLEGPVDAFLAIPVESQKLRARKIGRVIENSAIDRPWSQYFCCMLYSSAEFIRQYPIAT